MRSIGLTLGSALSAAVLTANTRVGQAIPDVEGFRDTLLIAAGVCVVTAILSFILPSRTANGGPVQSLSERKELEEIMKEEAELAGAGLVLAEDQNPLAPSSEDPS